MLLPREAEGENAHREKYKGTKERRERNEKKKRLSHRAKAISVPVALDLPQHFLAVQFWHAHYTNHNKSEYTIASREATKQQQHERTEQAVAAHRRRGRGPNRVVRSTRTCQRQPVARDRTGLRSDAARALTVHADIRLRRPAMRTIP